MYQITTFLALKIFLDCYMAINFKYLMDISWKQVVAGSSYSFGRHSDSVPVSTN